MRFSGPELTYGIGKAWQYWFPRNGLWVVQAVRLSAWTIEVYFALIWINEPPELCPIVQVFLHFGLSYKEAVCSRS